jgi:hypothetical protein
MEVPVDITARHAKQMLATLHNERAKLEVQKVTNNHPDNHRCTNEMTYAERFAFLDEAEDRLRDKYGELLDS